MFKHQNSPWEGGRLYRYEHFRIVVAHSVLRAIGNCGRGASRGVIEFYSAGKYRPAGRP